MSASETGLDQISLMSLFEVLAPKRQTIGGYQCCSAKPRYTRYLPRLIKSASFALTLYLDLTGCKLNGVDPNQTTDTSVNLSTLVMCILLVSFSFLGWA